MTPLANGGASLDEDAFGPLVGVPSYPGELDYVLACGTTGEDLCWSLRGTESAPSELFLAAPPARFLLPRPRTAGRRPPPITCHAAGPRGRGRGRRGGGQSHLRTSSFDERSLVEHSASAADACAPLPFYVYEFAARSGYAIPVTVIERLLADEPNPGSEGVRRAVRGAWSRTCFERPRRVHRVRATRPTRPAAVVAVGRRLRPGRGPSRS